VVNQVDFTVPAGHDLVNQVDLIAGGTTAMAVIEGKEAPVHEMHGATFTARTSPSRGSSETSVWQVELPPGTPGTPHTMTREEVLVVVSGRARVTIGDATSEAATGDTIVVPPDVVFDLSNPGDEPLRAIVCLPVGGQARIGDQSFTPAWAQ
jgi:quercetin dioxygenase-like cupin family protein